MPYKKYTRKRRFYRRKKVSLSAKVNKIAKTLKRQKPELKYTDVASSTQQFNYDPTVNYVWALLGNITQGTADVNSRVGDTIFVKSLTLSCTLYNSTYTPFNGRIIILRVRQNSENLITTTNLGNQFLESAYTGAAACVNAPYDNDNRNNFVVLMDHSFNINPSSNVNGVNTSMIQARHFKRTFRVNQRVEFFQGAAATTKNGLYALWLSDTTASASQVGNIVIRVHYTDS